MRDTGAGYRILLIDDDPDLLKLVPYRLRSAGYQVFTASSGEVALNNIAEIRPQLIIVDLLMGGMSGMEFYDALREMHHTMPVIILTAHGTISEAVTATKKGVFSFLTKPFDSVELMSEIERALTIYGGSELAAESENDGWREGIITRSATMEERLRKLKLTAKSDASVLLTGESGTGKELFAKALHLASPRSGNPFVPINCGAIPEPLLESELFGHVKGAFTGAQFHREGLFKAANNGTLFLDEIGDMPTPLQVKLLRVLQSGEFRPLGARDSETVNVRIVSATNQDLEALVKEGQFREDLYYRLNVVQIKLPALSARREDIPLLAEHSLRQFVKKGQKKVSDFSPEAMELLVRAPWPGNVRQLQNVVEQAYALTTTEIIPLQLVEDAIRTTPQDYLSLAEARRRFELDYLVKVMKLCEGNVTKASNLAGRNRTEFYKLLNRHHLAPEMFKTDSQ